MGIGIDLVQVKRFKNKGRILPYFLSKRELKLATNININASLWAIKEAASKAIGTGISKECGFFDIKISRGKHNNLKVKYTKRLRDKYKIKKSFVSVSYTGNYVIAVVQNI